MSSRIIEAIRKETPAILTYGGIVGFLGATMSAITVTPKAVYILEQQEGTIPEEGKERYIAQARVLLPIYGPTIGLLLLSTSMVLGANKVNSRRNAAVTSLFFATQRSLKALQGTVIEEFGAGKAEELITRAAQPSPENQPIPTRLLDGSGTLVWDSFSARYFKVADVTNMRNQITDLHAQLVNENFVSYNDLCYAVGMPQTEFGDEYGWGVEDGGIDHTLTSALDPATREPYVVLSFSMYPRHTSGDTYG